MHGESESSILSMSTKVEAHGWRAAARTGGSTYDLTVRKGRDAGLPRRPSKVNAMLNGIFSLICFIGSVPFRIIGALQGLYWALTGKVKIWELYT